MGSDGGTASRRRADDGRRADSPGHYVALGDSISIDDYSGGPGRGGASLLLANRDDDFPGLWFCNLIEPNAWGAGGVRAAFWSALEGA